jgi:hypothetical protein
MLLHYTTLPLWQENTQTRLQVRDTASRRHGFKAEGNREGKKEWMSAGLSHKYGYCNSHGFLFVFFQIFLATRGWLWYMRSDGGQNGKPKP